MGMNSISRLLKILGLLTIIIQLAACSEENNVTPEVENDSTTVENPVSNFDINSIEDTYGEIAAYENARKWGPYNVHDPSIIKDGDYYYCYNTDVGYGTEVPAGIQIRKSKDLVEWQYVGRVFNGLPQQGADFIKSKGVEPFDALWAPYIYKHGDEFRLYYSLSSSAPRLSVIGLATAPTPVGPWTEKGLVVTSVNDNSIQTNAIDPTVVIDKSGNHWFYYGSAWDGIYYLQLDPDTGLALKGNDKGKRIAQRGFTGNSINGNIEGPEIIYNEEFGKYYLFIAYDWLQTKYNVRVGRADSPEGPFYDFNGNDLNDEEDNIPMILAPYQFEGHSGWQGVAHCAVFKEGDQYYMAHQGRPGIDSYYMVLHVRKMFWTEDGWPIVSPERYAALEQTEIAESDLVGDWEQIDLGYKVVPGYADEQLSADFQVAVDLTLDAAGTINGEESSTWSYNAPWLELNWADANPAKVYVEQGRDWENKVEKTLIFSGLNNEGTALWGKKKSN